MEGLFDLFYWDSSYNGTLIANLAICIAIIASVRLFSGTISHVNATEELIKKDNPAFGISLAGVIFGVTIVLTSVIYSEQPVLNMMDSAISVGLYGILGIILMGVTRIVFDRICFPDISIRDEIAKGNIAAGIIDAGNVIATALIIRAVMVWVNANTVEGVSALLVAYIISQLLLTLSTYIRLKLLTSKNNGKSIINAFKKGNVALAVTFAGKRIGTAFAITAASYLMVYEFNNIYELLLVWSLISIGMMLALKVLTFVGNKTILAGIDVKKEVITQKNIALGAVQAVMYISLGLLLAELMA
jgi:uncharacterized membrane protein YjfL (UPF0719 family)